MELLDLDVSLEQGNGPCLNLLGQRLAQRVLAIEQIGKRQQRPDGLGRLDHAGRSRHRLRDLIRKGVPAVREGAAQVDGLWRWCRRPCRLRHRYRCRSRRWRRLGGRCRHLRCWVRCRSRLLFDDLASGPATGQQDAERENEQASRALGQSSLAQASIGRPIVKSVTASPIASSPPCLLLIRTSHRAMGRSLHLVSDGDERLVEAAHPTRRRASTLAH